MNKLILSLIFAFILNNLFANNTLKENIESKYNIKIITDINGHLTEPMWKEYGSYFKFKQITPEELNNLLNIIDNCFSVYGKSIIDNCFDEIFLIQNLNLNDIDYAVINVANLLYIAADKNKEEIINEIHRNIAEMLFGKYGYLLSEKEFTKNNPENFNYGDSIQTKDLLNSGFLNKRSSQNFKEDFISVFSLNISKKDSIDFYKSKYLSLKNKFAIVDSFYHKLVDSKNLILPESIKNKIAELENKYGLSINVNYSIFNFPYMWIRSNYSPTGKQIEENNLIKLLGYLESFLASNKNSYEPYFLKKVEIIGNMQIGDKPNDAQYYNSILFLSDNFLKQYDFQKYNNLIRTNLFVLVYRNLYPYFPIDDWQKVNSSANDSAYLSEYGKQYFYYDMMDFYFAYLDSNYSKTNEFINKKIALIRQFYQSSTKDIQNLKSYDFKAHEKEIEEKYKINIIDFSDNDLHDERIPLTLAINETINDLQLKRILEVLPEFLVNIKQENLSHLLKNVFLVGNMEFLQMGNTDKVAGTYEPVQKSILISNLGNSKTEMLCNLYHEFSSIILYSYKKQFDKEKWLAVNEKGFSYNSNNNHTNIYSINEDFNQKGFIDDYGTTCFENDYNEYAKLYFLNKSNLESLANTYPKINQKYQILKAFYDNILRENKGN